MKNILCYGDSNTYGYYPETNGRYEYEERWVGILQEKVKDKGYRVIDEGLNGRTTIFPDDRPEGLPNRIGRNGLEYFPVFLETHYPIDILIIMLGTNDCKTRYQNDEKDISNGMRMLLEVVKNAGYPIKTLLISPAALGYTSHNISDIEFGIHSNEVSHKIAFEYEKLASEYSIMFLDATPIAKLSNLDNIHLNKEGHKALANAIYDKIKDIL